MKRVLDLCTHHAFVIIFFCLTFSWLDLLVNGIVECDFHDVPVNVQSLQVFLEASVAGGRHENAKDREQD